MAWTSRAGRAGETAGIGCPAGTSKPASCTGHRACRWYGSRGAFRPKPGMMKMSARRGPVIPPCCHDRRAAIFSCPGHDPGRPRVLPVRGTTRVEGPHLTALDRAPDRIPVAHRHRFAPDRWDLRRPGAGWRRGGAGRLAGAGCLGGVRRPQAHVVTYALLRRRRAIVAPSAVADLRPGRSPDPALGSHRRWVTICAQMRGKSRSEGSLRARRRPPGPRPRP
jgi:hypothetical protein